MSTHNLCFGAKIRKIGIPLQTSVLLYKIGFQGGYTLHGHVFLMCACIALLVSNMSGNHIVGFFMTQLKYAANCLEKLEEV